MSGSRLTWSEIRRTDLGLELRCQADTQVLRITLATTGALKLEGWLPREVPIAALIGPVGFLHAAQRQSRRRPA